MDNTDEKSKNENKAVYLSWIIRLKYAKSKIKLYICHDKYG